MYALYCLLIVWAWFLGVWWAHYCLPAVAVCKAVF